MKAGCIPVWFYEWWDIFGPVKNILPSSIIETMERWETWHPLIRGKENLSKNNNLILLFIDYGIPWILKWNFCIQKDTSIDNYALKREFWVR